MNSDKPKRRWRRVNLSLDDDILEAFNAALKVGCFPTRAKALSAQVDQWMARFLRHYQHRVRKMGIVIPEQALEEPERLKPTWTKRGPYNPLFRSQMRK